MVILLWLFKDNLKKKLFKLKVDVHIMYNNFTKI